MYSVFNMYLYFILDIGIIRTTSFLVASGFIEFIESSHHVYMFMLRIFVKKKYLKLT